MLVVSVWRCCTVGLKPPRRSGRRPEHAGIFPTFFLSGFECSTFIWKDKGRRDLVEETQHRKHADEDYAFLRSLGIAVAREGIPWPLRRPGRSFRLLAARSVHRGDEPPPDPSDLGPVPLRLSGRARSLRPDFVERFAAYARAAAEYVVPRMRGPHFFTPINEITFFGFMGGEWAWAAPFGKTDEKRRELRLALCRADIAAVKAIREVDPRRPHGPYRPARSSWFRPRDRPDLADEARPRDLRGHLLRLGRASAGGAIPDRRLAGDPRYRRRQLLLVRPDGISRAGTPRLARAR